MNGRVLGIFMENRQNETNRVMMIWERYLHMFNVVSLTVSQNALLYASTKNYAQQKSEEVQHLGGRTLRLVIRAENAAYWLVSSLHALAMHRVFTDGAVPHNVSHFPLLHLDSVAETANISNLPTWVLSARRELLEMTEFHSSKWPRV
jgi:hypothetical protein